MQVDVMQTVNIHEAKTHFSKLINPACQGEEIIIVKAGIPLIRLVPIKACLKSIFTARFS